MCRILSQFGTLFIEPVSDRAIVLDLDSQFQLTSDDTRDQECPPHHLPLAFCHCHFENSGKGLHNVSNAIFKVSF